MRVTKQMIMSCGKILLGTATDFRKNIEKSVDPGGEIELPK
jgi:hypothetical protein